MSNMTISIVNPIDPHKALREGEKKAQNLQSILLPRLRDLRKQVRNITDTIYDLNGLPPDSVTRMHINMVDQAERDLDKIYKYMGNVFLKSKRAWKHGKI